MKAKIVLSIMTGLALAATFTTGCSTTGPGSAGFTPAKAEKLMTFAARTATRARLITHPDERPVFEAAAQALGDFANTTNATVADLAAILAQLPIKDLRDGDTGLYIEGALLIYDLTLGDQVGVDLTLLQPVARGLHSGIVQGLGRGKVKMKRATASANLKWQILDLECETEYHMKGGGVSLASNRSNPVKVKCATVAAPAFFTREATASSEGSGRPEQLSEGLDESLVTRRSGLIPGSSLQARSFPQRVCSAAPPSPVSTLILGLS